MKSNWPKGGIGFLYIKLNELEMSCKNEPVYLS